VVLAGRDLLGAAQTGTGKTAGFTLPLLQLLSSRPRNGNAPRCLILTPTRELAAQVEESVTTYGKYLKLRSTVIFGGVGINPQIAELRRGVDIVVATPGRLLDHVQQKTVDLKSIEILVLDVPIACSTWASSATSSASSLCCPGSARTCCSRRPSPTRSARCRANTCTTRRRWKSPGATRRPSW
jgi:hypothetical protein